MRTESTRHIYRKCTDIDIDIDIEEHDSKMGAICTQLHDQSNARQCYEDAVNVARSVTDSRLPLSSVAARTVARSLYNLALIHSTKGRICEAIDFCMRDLGEDC